MPDELEIERRLTKLETSVEFIREKLDEEEPEKTLLQQVLDSANWKNFFYLIGIPVTAVAAYTQFEEKVWNPDKYEAIAQRGVAVEKVSRLQQINSEIFALQSQGKEAEAFARVEATRGQIQRLTGDVYELWKKFPNLFGLYEKYTLVEALLSSGETDSALAVANSVDIDRLDTIETSDLSLLKGRIQYAEGPAFDIEAARQHMRDAGAAAQTLEREGQQMQMFEKILAVRAINELWRGTDCAEVAPFAETLAEMVEMMPVPEDSVDVGRDNTLAVLGQFQASCGES
ncbi:MAG: hypothetical protein AAGA12_12300 [Pseudomonadota bacterium]